MVIGKMILLIIGFLGFFRARVYALCIHEVHMNSKSLLPLIIERYTTLLPPLPLPPQESMVEQLQRVVYLNNWWAMKIFAAFEFSLSLT